MKRHRSSWLTFIKATLRASKGRPVALVVLFTLSPAQPVQRISSQCIASGMDENDRRNRERLIRCASAIIVRTIISVDSRAFRLRSRWTIVEIDDKTLAEIGQWPWPRNRLADLIDAIAAQKPAAIGLDIYMPEPDQTSPDKVADNLPATAADLAARLRALPSHEAILAQSLRAAPSILGAAAFDRSGVCHPHRYAKRADSRTRCRPP